MPAKLTVAEPRHGHGHQVSQGLSAANIWLPEQTVCVNTCANCAGSDSFRYDVHICDVSVAQWQTSYLLLPHTPAPLDTTHLGIPSATCASWKMEIPRAVDIFLFCRCAVDFGGDILALKVTTGYYFA